jgi:hypothetical protein
MVGQRMMILMGEMIKMKDTKKGIIERKTYIDW